MHGIEFLKDLAVIMVVAGCTTLVFHRLRQPVVLGYILAGLLIGPHTPPFALITSEETIRSFADLGVVLLMFSLGLEFSLRRLREVGVAALVATGVEVMLMLWAGYELGRWFGWRTMDALFLGAMMAISSTMLVLRAIHEAGHKQERFARLVFGILVIEDVIAIVLIALLSGIAISGAVEPGRALATLGRLGLFIVVALILGLLLLPRLIDYVAATGRSEMLLVTSLGICFGAALLAATAGFSVALGGFVAGAIVAEANAVRRVEHLIEPVRDMFGALFFVAIGMLIQPTLLIRHALPVVLVAAVVVLGKTLAVTFGGVIAGNDGRTALRAGLGLAQIGEFSFVIAGVGLASGVTSDFLYPIAVGASVLAAFVTPYLLRSSDLLADRAGVALPRKVRALMIAYQHWMAGLRLEQEGALIARMLRRLVLHIIINMALVVAVFLGAAWLKPRMLDWLPQWTAGETLRRSLLWSLALFLSMPMLIAAYRKADALGMVLAELGIREGVAGARTYALRRVLGKMIPLAVLVILAVLVMALGSAILPSRGVLVLLLLVAGALAAFLWRAFIQVHARLQATLRDVMQPSTPERHGETPP
ncbi:MAG: cation/H(+) antiporter [Lysobacterales bacterium 69-70]|mgnify:CR=1 FL=1|nr:cation:proton antiporter [Xanthomonadaceae bacterium]ODU34890.1 MAG: potassium transporter [Xanthomonadaceae bacterium SCN 69-320]ODV19781.1 MAG: potassium transporter [Xanthomonadaceae bacterium SCN 69-25]OJY95142.1 MAG: cation/H(+) antiporter [Xanthomonadales bacterium 69-70]